MPRSELEIPFVEIDSLVVIGSRTILQFTEEKPVPNRQKGGHGSEDGKQVHGGYRSGITPLFVFSGVLFNLKKPVVVVVQNVTMRKR